MSCVHPSVVVHDCRLRVDGISKYLNNQQFAFDHAFSENEDTAEIYRCVGGPLVEFVTRDDGRACIFAYGQTGSGKTYTMEGVQARAAVQVFRPDLQHARRRGRPPGPATELFLLTNPGTARRRSRRTKHRQIAPTTALGTPAPRPAPGRPPWYKFYLTQFDRRRRYKPARHPASRTRPEDRRRTCKFRRCPRFRRRRGQTRTAGCLSISRCRRPATGNHALQLRDGRKTRRRGLYSIPPFSR